MVLFHPGIHPGMNNAVIPTFQIFGRILCIDVIFEYIVHIVYLIKMKVLTYTLYNEHCELYSEIHGSIAVNSCQVELARKDIILLSNVSVI